ncbi:hypothetical protein CB1_000493004 [Camelus ferus]|nr:hypothetical protein CB1_000493004 [Camelus ferus]
MSSALKMKKMAVLKFLATGTPLGGFGLDFQMEQNTCKGKSDGLNLINLKRSWEKLLLAAPAIAATENPGDVSATSSRKTGQRAVLKVAAATGATPAGPLTAGTFSNQIQAALREPRPVVVTASSLSPRPLTAYHCSG